MTNQEINYRVHRALGRGWLPIPDYCSGEDTMHIPGDTEEYRAKCIRYLVEQGAIKAASVA